MNAREKYELILKSIEQLIVENELSNREIGDKAFADANLPMSDREKNTIFGFLLDKKLFQYISERRLMIGYKYLINESNKRTAYKKALDISGSSEQSAFITKFKKQFGITPDVARIRKDSSLYKSIPSWECISGNIENTMENDNMIETRFDIPINQFKIIQEALNLQDFYSLNKEESEFAFSLYKGGIDIEKAYEYLGNYIAGNDAENRDERLEADLSRDDVKYLYFDCDLGFEEIFVVLLMQRLNQFSNPTNSYNRHFFQGLVNYAYNLALTIPTDTKTPYEIKYKYYIENSTEQYTEEDFFKYNILLRSYDHKTAFSMITAGESKIERNSTETSYEELDMVYTEEELFDRSYRYRKTEPEVWDEDYVSYFGDEEEDSLLEDEDEWILREIEGPENDINENEVYNEDEYFDVDSFEELCHEISDYYEENDNNEEKPGKGFSGHKNLDVEMYMNGPISSIWKNLSDILVF